MTLALMMKLILTSFEILYFFENMIYNLDTANHTN